LLVDEKIDQPLLEGIYSQRDMLSKHSQWIIGGDGWAYDIGFGGLDHVLAKGENVNIMVLDTEMYSNTGGQVSKSTPQSALVKFASAGKSQAKKDMGQHAMNYGNVYVASMAMGADYNQSLQAIKEAESFDGPSLLMCYSPCIDWGIDMAKMMDIQKMAVDSGYWPLFRYDPRLKDKGEMPFQLDSKRIKSSLAGYLKNENRYAALTRSDAGRAEMLQGAFEDYTIKRMEHMQRTSMDDSELLDFLKESVGESTGEKVLVLYASETGITADLAKHVVYEMKRRGVRCKAVKFDDYDLQDLPKEKTVVNLVATCGQGEFPQNCRMFKNDIDDDTLPNDFLSGVKFATFAMGDSGYVFYNSCGTMIDERFEELGGQRLVPVGLGDDQAEDKWETAYQDWEPELWNEMGTPPPPKVLLPASHTVVVQAKEDAAPDVVIPEYIVPKDAAGSGIMVPMTMSRPLTPLGRDVRHYEWDISNVDCEYEAGDAMGVFSTNGRDKTEEFLQWYGLAADDVIHLAVQEGQEGLDLPTTVTALQLFSQHLDIFGRPKRPFYETMSLLATDDEEKAELEHLITKEGRGDLREIIDDTITYAELMQKFPSARVPIEYLLGKQ
tara:strand:- start:47 stop:1873 length:1827 start_codon:yes stop_codon:yes gene_type:complete